MDSESANLFEDEEPRFGDPQIDITAETANSKSTSTHSPDPVRDIEKWFMESLKAAIPEDMHSIYINENNVLFACGSLEVKEFDLKRQTECVYEITNRGKRSVLSSFDTITYYTNLTYRNEVQRKRVSLDHMTDPAFLRVIEPRTGKFILSNLIKCASQQQKGLRSYLEYVKKNIFSFPLLEELNRFALSHKLAYRSARQKLWFIMGLAEELKLVELGKVYKKYSEKDSVEFNRNVLDKNVTLRYFKTTQKQDTTLSQASQSSKQEYGMSQVSQVLKSESILNPNQGDSSNSHLASEHDTFSSSSKILSDAMADSNLSYSNLDQPNSVSMSSSVNRFDTNLGYTQDQTQSYTVGMSSLQDSNISLGSEGSQAIGFSSLHIGEMSTPLRRHVTVESKQQVDSFDRNFMKLIDEESTPLFEFDNFMEGSKSQSTFTETSQTGWKGLKMIKKSKIKVEEPKMGHFVQRGLDKFVKKKQSFAFKNAVTTISVLEAACKLYGKGPKWSNPNMKEFDLSNKAKKVVYVKPSKSIKEADLTYQYMLQYASVHQKLNGGVRQEHAVQYGIIEVNKPSDNEPRSYTVNTEPWKLEKFERKWLKLASEINFSPWLIAKFNDLKVTEKGSEAKLAREKAQVEETKSEQAVDVDNSSTLEHFDSTVQKDGDNGTRECVDKHFSIDVQQLGGKEATITAEQLENKLPSTLEKSYNKLSTTLEKSDNSQESIPIDESDEKQVTAVEADVKQDNTIVDEKSQEVFEYRNVSQVVKMEPTNYESELQVSCDTQQLLSPSQVVGRSEPQDIPLYSDTQMVPESYEDGLPLKVKTELSEETLESVRTSSTCVDVSDNIVADHQDEEEYNNDEMTMETNEDTKVSNEQVESAEQKESNEDANRQSQNKTNNLVGPDGKQMKLTELFKYVYNKINKAKNLPEFPELRLINRFNPVVKEELENFSHMDKKVQINTKRRKVLDDEYVEPLPENYVRIGGGRNQTGVSQVLTDSEDEDYKRVDDEVNLDLDNKEVGFAGKFDAKVGADEGEFEGGHRVKFGSDVTGKAEGDATGKADVEEKNKNKKDKQTKKSKISRKEKIMRMREIMKSMIEFEAVESEDENLSDPEEIKRSLELLKDKLMNPSETESEIESETEIAKEMKDFIGEVEINEEDEEIARLRFNEDQMLADDAELKKVMAFKEKGELELTRREERLRLLEEMKKSREDNGYHLSDFESSDEETGTARKIKVKVTGEDIDRLLRFKQTQKEMSKQEQLEQFIDYKLTEANIKLPSVEEVPVSTSFIDVPKVTQTHEPVTKIKNRRDIVDNMFNEGLDSIFSNIEEYRSDSSFTVNPFGTPNRALDKIDNSSSKSPKKPAIVMKSFRWDHSQAKPGNTTTVRNFKGFTGFHNLPSSFTQNKATNK